jgi:hypothetical protein
MRWKQPAVILIAAVLCLPFIRYVHWLGDEGVLLHGAQRMLAGDRIYKDFFEFLPPLPFLAVAGWLKLVGMSLFGARILAIAVIAGIAAAIRSACGAGRLGTAIALGWLLASQGAMTVLNHRWFATLLAMLAIALLVRLLDGSRAIALALAIGLCVGAAAMCTPTFGLLGVCVLAILLSARRPAAELGAVIAGGLVLPALMILYLHGSLHEAAHDVLGFLFARYASIQRVRFGSGVGFQNFLIVAFFPALAVLALLVRPGPFFATGLLALCGLLLAFPRPDATHLGFAVPLACPFLATCLRNLAPRRIFDVVAIAALGATLVAYVDVAQTVLRLPVVRTAAGGVRFGPGAGDSIAALLAQIDAHPGRYFFYPYDPMLPFLSQRRHVAAVDLLTPEYTWPEHYRDTARAVLANADCVVIDRLWADPAHIRALWPAISDAHPPETAAFEETLASAFPPAWTSDRFALRCRR